jgi:hypothetical protein
MTLIKSLQSTIFSLIFLLLHFRTAKNLPHDGGLLGRGWFWHTYLLLLRLLLGHGNISDKGVLCQHNMLLTLLIVD